MVRMGLGAYLEDVNKCCSSQEVIMLMFGAGSVQAYKGSKRVERVHKRDLAPVSAEYTQDIMPYKEGFWAQYGGRMVLSSLGFIASLALWIAYFSPWVSNADAWGMGPTMVFLLILTPIMGALPIWYVVQYHRMQRVLSEDDGELGELTEDGVSLLEIME